MSREFEFNLARLVLEANESMAALLQMFLFRVLILEKEVIPPDYFLALTVPSNQGSPDQSSFF